MNLPSVIQLRDTSAVLKMPCGGKATGLAKLFAAGVQVPEGVVILSDIEDQTTIIGLEKWLQRKSHLSRPSTLFAVRSSALCEDGHASSFAGMFDTFLNVKREDVPARVAQCQQSSKNERVKSYAQRSGISLGTLPVIVQEMLTPTAAGVCFTVNPISGNVQEVMIEAVCGVGDRLVSGEVTPDSWVLDTEGNILDHEIGDESPPDLPCLFPFEVNALTRKSIALQNSFGHPLDIEFAFTRDGLFFLQARPITTLQLAA